jgi:beta-ring hydroxylase
MISLFGEATDRLCKKLDAAAFYGEDVEMESLFSRLTLDIIGRAVFNYDFDSLTNDTGIVEVLFLLSILSLFSQTALCAFIYLPA